jgi:AcrR family transcriptional regulator
MNAKPRRRDIRRRIPVQERAQITVSAVLDAAGLVLRSGGLAGFNTNKVAKRAGISIGTLYGYFRNKDAILIALARQIVEEDAQAMAKVLNEGHGSETLRHLLRVLFKRHLEDGFVRRTVMSTYVSAGFGEEHDFRVETIVKSLISRPEKLLGADLKSIGEERLFTASRAVIGIARSFAEVSGSARFPLQVIEDEAVALIHAYLSPPPRTPE